jgi:hypothetical protein
MPAITQNDRPVETLPVSALPVETRPLSRAPLTISGTLVDVRARQTPAGPWARAYLLEPDGQSTRVVARGVQADALRRAVGAVELEAHSCLMRLPGASHSVPALRVIALRPQPGLMRLSQSDLRARLRTATLPRVARDIGCTPDQLRRRCLQLCVEFRLSETASV